jgi:hypothetical protein
MSIFAAPFEEVELVVSGEKILADFEVSFTYTASGCSPRRLGRVEELSYYESEIVIRNIDTDEETTVHLPARAGDDLAHQVETAIWAQEDWLYELAEDDLAGEFSNAQEARWEAARDDRLCGDL